MKITVKVLAGSSKTNIEKVGNRSYRVKLKAKAKENEANQELVKLLSKEFKIAKSLVSIVSGRKAKIKIIEINNK